MMSFVVWILPLMAINNPPISRHVLLPASPAWLSRCTAFPVPSSLFLWTQTMLPSNAPISWWIPASRSISCWRISPGSISIRYSDVVTNLVTTRRSAAGWPPWWPTGGHWTGQDVVKGQIEHYLARYLVSDDDIHRCYFSKSIGGPRGWKCSRYLPTIKILLKSDFSSDITHFFAIIGGPGPPKEI